MGKNVIELPPIYIGVDPYPVRTPSGRPPSPHDYPGFGIPGHPSGRQSAIYKSMLSKKKDYCGGDWLKAFQDILEKEKGLVVQSKNELRLVAGTDFLCALGWSPEIAYVKVLDSAVFNKAPVDHAVPYQTNDRVFSGGL